MRRFAFVLLLLLGLPGLAGTRHAYHSSIMELKINNQQLQVEVALKVFTDDFEKALSQGQPQAVSMRDISALSLVERYMLQHVRLSLPPTPRQSRSPLQLKFMGRQAEKDGYWLYAKAPLPHTTTELLVRQEVLLELFSDQMNIVNAEANGKKVSALLRKGHEEQILTF